MLGELRGVLFERAFGAVFGGVEDLGNLFVDDLGGVLAELALVLGRFRGRGRDDLRSCDRRPARAARSCPSA